MLVKKLLNISGSHALIIPMAFARQLNFDFNGKVAVELRDSEIIIKNVAVQDDDSRESR